MNKRVTLKDIARATGVHVSTVSRALDPKRNATLSDDVVKKIRQSADALGYRPNRVAYSLRTNRTMTIGVMIPDITNTLFPPIVRGIESVMEPEGYASILVNTDGQQGREVALLATLRDRGVDGIVHTAALRDDPSIVKAAQSGLPVVTLNRKIEGAPIPYIINDDRAGIAAAYQHLTEFGHSRIAHIAGPSDLSTGQLRRAAFVEAARAGGANPATLTISEAKRFDEEEGCRCALEVLDRAPETTALLCANDRLALGALRALSLRGLSCPADVSITGFNDMPFLDLIPPGLTTVRIRQFEAGQTAARSLLALMRDDTDPVPVETILPVELVRRNSVAPPRGAPQP